MDKWKNAVAFKSNFDALSSSTIQGYQEEIKQELEEEEKVGRPKDPVRYGKDDHPMGRDPLGDKTLKRKEGYSTYNKYKMNYQEIFRDMDGNAKKIITS